MVFEELTGSWERAIKRATIRGIAPRKYDERVSDHVAVRRYFVDSGMRTGCATASGFR